MYRELGMPRDKDTLLHTRSRHADTPRCDLVCFTRRTDGCPLPSGHLPDYQRYEEIPVPCQGSLRLAPHNTLLHALMTYWHRRRRPDRQMI